jgi:hypothetical protein
MQRLDAPILWGAHLAHWLLGLAVGIAWASTHEARFNAKPQVSMGM